jgi:hypothetical protein
MIRALPFLLALPASAETIGLPRHLHFPSTITLQPTEAPGAVAEVVFQNKAVNNDKDNGSYALTMGGLTVSVEFIWDAQGGEDAIRVTPPPGYFAHPEILPLVEGTTGVILIYDMEAVGL